MRFPVLLFLLIGIIQVFGQDRPTFKVGIDMVQLNVSVTDNKKRVVGLKKEDFIVYENNSRQKIEFFQAGNQSVSITLLIDASASMLIREPDSRTAALELMRYLGPNDQVRIVQFSEEVSILQNFTTDHGSAVQAIGKVREYGRTAIYNAIYTLLSPRIDPGAQVDVAILITDGENTSSRDQIDAIADMIKTTDTIIYIIKLGDIKVPALDRYFLEMTAQETGGQLYPVRDTKQLEKAYARISIDIKDKYTIGYVSNNARLPGSWRTVSVNIPKHPKFKVHHRKGYYTASEN